jgi:hypothetical protein
MAYVYFRKDNQRFSHVSVAPTPEYWLDEYEDATADVWHTYKLVDGQVVEDQTISPDNPPMDKATLDLYALRIARDQKLAETDWWALSDVTLTTERETYRQALRDITQHYQSIETVVWPVKPA